MKRKDSGDVEMASRDAREQLSTAGSFKTDPKQKSELWIAIGFGCFTALAFILPIIIFPLAGRPVGVKHYDATCRSDCTMKIVETLPKVMGYANGDVDTYGAISDEESYGTYNAWADIISKAEDEIKILSMYWTLNHGVGAECPAWKKCDKQFKTCVHTNEKCEADKLNCYKGTSAWQGHDIYNKLVDAGRRGVKISIVQSPGHETNKKSWFPSFDSSSLKKLVKADVRDLQLEKLYVHEDGLRDGPKRLNGGIQHAKVIIVDKKHAYLGSANMDWRSLSEVKELGVLVKDCDCIAKDFEHIFDINHRAAGQAEYSSFYATKNVVDWAQFNDTRPHLVAFNQGRDQTETFISSAPPGLNAKGRTNDIDALLAVINDAEEKLDVSVMSYSPFEHYFFDQTKLESWTELQDALVNAALRGVKVRMLLSDWVNTKPKSVYAFDTLKNAERIVNILMNSNSHKEGWPHKRGRYFDLRWFRLPQEMNTEDRISHSRTNHPKYVVSEKDMYVSTSNWEKGYFYNSVGVSLISRRTSKETDSSVRQRLSALFERDFTSTLTSKYEEGGEAARVADDLEKSKQSAETPKSQEKAKSLPKRYGGQSTK